MKFLKLLTLSLLFASASYAQNFEIVSTYPANGEHVQWPDSIAITFNQKVDFTMEELDTEFSRLSFLIEPEESVELEYFTLSEDSMSVIFWGDKAHNTHFVAIVDFAVSASGDTLNAPYLFNFATYPPGESYVVEGSLPEPEMIKALETGNDQEIIVTLGTEPLYFGPEPQNCNGPDDCEPTDETEDDGYTPLYAAFVDLETGTFSIPGVDEGSYYVYGFNFYDEEEDSLQDEYFIPDFYYYDPDGNLIVDPIVVSAATTVNDTLAIELSKMEFVPISLAKALDIAEPVLAQLDDEAYLVGGITHFSYDGDGFGGGDSLEAFKSKSKLAKNIRALPDFISTDVPAEEPRVNPSGLQYQWNLFGYDPVKDSAFTILSTPFGATFGFYLGKDDANIPSEVLFTDVAPLPDSFIDSDEATAIIEENGGADFRAIFEELGYWEMELQALNNFWDVNTDTLIEDLPVMWSAFYYGFYLDFESFEFVEGAFEIYLDIETGEVIHSRFMMGDDEEDGGITFAMALDIADSVITSLGDDAVIAGGSTYYYSNSLFEDEKMEDPLLKQKAAQIALRAPKQESVLPYDDTPDGYQYEWMIYGYDATKDSLFSIYVDEYGAEFEGYVDRYQADIPDTVALDDIMGLPDFFIDSDSAVALIEMYGGEEFRSEFSDLLSYWEMDLEALNNFWELNEDTLIADVPVMWSAEYYGLGYDIFTGAYYSGYMIIYIDMETGELIYSRYELDEYDFSSHITFDEAVDLADSLVSTLPNDPVLFGGYTNYNNEEILFKKTGKEKIRDNHLLDTEPGMVSPDGYAYSWELYFYDSVIDSMILVNVTEYDTYVTAYMGEEDLEEPLDFSDVLPLPSPHIDSDSAAAIISMYGAGEFLGSKEESELYWTWDYDLSLFHHYWEYPLDPTPNAPVTWKAELHAWAWDDEAEEYIEDSLLIYIDAETGEVLVGPTINANENELDSPVEFSLMQNYPNPFNPSTNIPFELSEAAEVTISVYSVLGQKVATLVNGRYQAGQHSVQFNAQNLASGVYVYRMEAKNFSQTRKLLLLK